MKLHIYDSHQFTFTSNIQTAALFHGQDLLVLNEVGDVVLYHKEEDHEVAIFEVTPKKGVQYTDGGFIPTEKSSIYTMDDMFIVSNDYNTHCIFCDYI